jgi:superfamily II DNA or RNA helicase
MTHAPPDDFRPTFATNRPPAGETVADAINRLLRGMRDHLAAPPPVAIATAFFNPGGFRLLANELEQVGPVRLLLGAEPKAEEQTQVRPLAAGRGRPADRKQVRRTLEAHSRSLSNDRNLVGFTRQADADARRLVAWLRRRSPEAEARQAVEVRRFTGGFLHGKAFIVDTAMPHVMSGSSNFTYAGLARNRELNLGQFNPVTVASVRGWFEDLWEASEPFDLAALYEKRWYAHQPWHVFLRMLYELYGKEVEEEASAHVRSHLGLTSFQIDGVWRAKRILSRYHGVIIADEVGLGKTFIAGELIHEATIGRRQKVLVVAPATLRDATWKPFFRETNLPAQVISFEELVSGLGNAGPPTAALQSPDAYAMVVVDEAHFLRNALTRRSDALRRLLTGMVAKDLLLLTATPVNNSLYDLYNLISYFVTSDAAFTDAGVPSLKRYFDQAMAINPNDLSPEHLFDVVDQVVVRRTRQFVKHHYVGDVVTIGGVEQQVHFPAPLVRRIDYDLSAALPEVFDQLAVALGAQVLDRHPDTEAVLLDAPGEVLSLARYVPSRFRLGTDEESQYEAQNAGLLRSALLKRFESSAYSFRRTVEKMITSHEQFLKALATGHVLTGDALREWMASDSDDIEVFLDGYNGTAGNIGSIADYHVDDLRDAVEADRDLLKELHNRVRILPWNEDPKHLALTEVLAGIVADAEYEGVDDQQIRDKRKVLIFSYFADTVEHLTSQVRAAVEADDRLAAYRERIATASGQDRRGRAEVLAGFAPRTAGTEDSEDLYDILIATDVLSEGVNLQQARHVVNYDLPWNPMRLVQRHGRIDRIGSKHPEAFIHCYFPDRQLETLLGLEERLQRKLKQAAAAVGVSQVLPGMAGRDVTFSETRDEIDRLRSQEATLFEEGGPSALSGEEYRRTLERELIDQYTRTTILDLPWGAGSGFVRSGAAQPGFVFCARIADHHTPWFRYLPLTPEHAVQQDEEGRPIVISDTLTCLSHANPPEPSTAGIFVEAEERNQYGSLYDAAYDAWAIAKSDIHTAWTYNSDPENLAQPVPKVMRDAADLVRTVGTFLGNQQDDLVDRLEAPYPFRLQQLFRTVLNDRKLSGRERVLRLQTLADQLGLTRQEAPPPLPPITIDDIHLVCWLAVTPDGP